MTTLVMNTRAAATDARLAIPIDLGYRLVVAEL